MFCPVQPHQIDALKKLVRLMNTSRLVDHLPLEGFHLAVVDNDIAGFVHFSEPKVGEVWLQAMRVLPAYRNRGLGTAFAEYQLEVARNMKAQVVRLMTRESNEKIQWIMGFRLGFEQCSIYLRGRRAKMKVIPKLKQISVASLALVPILWEFIVDAYQWSNGLIADTRDVQSYCSLDFEDFEQWVEDKRCLVSWKEDKVDGVLLFSEHDSELFINQLYAGTIESAIRLLDSAGFLATYYGYTLGISVADDRLGRFARRWWHKYTGLALKEFVVFGKELN